MRAAVHGLRNSKCNIRALARSNGLKLVVGKNLIANLGLTAEISSNRRLVAGEECAGRWSNIRPVAVVSMAVAAIVANDEAMCEVQQKHGEGASARSNCNLCDDSDNSSMSISFDTEYEPKKLLGCGTFGVVMQCVHKQTGRISAVKIVQNLLENQEEVEREMMALEQLERAGRHTCIIGYERSYCHNDFHYIVLEYVPGITLHSFVNEHRSLKTTLSLQLVSQLASALRFMHQENIVHCDLKPENIMVLVKHDRNDHIMHENANQSEEIALKIIDFGSAGRVSQPELVDEANPKTQSGTRCYWPPEALEHREMTAAMDMWALGCILYIIISGRHPFDLMGCSTEDEVIQRIKAEPVSFCLPVWHEIPTEIKALILGLLEKDPNERLSAEQVLKHPALPRLCDDLCRDV